MSDCRVSVDLYHTTLSGSRRILSSPRLHRASRVSVDFYHTTLSGSRRILSSPRLHRAVRPCDTLSDATEPCISVCIAVVCECRVMVDFYHTTLSDSRRILSSPRLHRAGQFNVIPRTGKNVILKSSKNSSVLSCWLLDNFETRYFFSFVWVLQWNHS